MKRIGIFANPTLEGIGEVVDHFVALFAARGATAVLLDELRAVCGKPAGVFCSKAELECQADLLLAMGGDGNLLRAARLVQATGTPILGVNLGRLGFLAEVDPDELEESLERLLDGAYEIEERMALTARVGDQTAFALNEVVIERTVTARQIQVKTWISEGLVSSFFGNGLIVSTPTGSTSYNLSAGGPVIHPAMDALIVTPICPHSLSLKPTVVPSDQSITVQTFAAPSDIMLTADGQTVCSLKPGDRVEVMRAETPVRLINLKGLSFYELLRRKLNWGLDRRE